MNICVLNPGLLTTIQDLGRNGYQKFGVIVSGAMDTYSMRLANILVGNEENEGVLEITLIGPSLKLKKGTLLSITGANLSPTINDEIVPSNRPVYINEDCVLKFGSCKSGCRSYLAIAGGFNIPSVLGSKSTYLRAGFGGYNGRALKKDDILEIGIINKTASKIIKNLIKANYTKIFSAPNWYFKNFIDLNSKSTTIKVFEGRQYNSISEDGINKFFNSEFLIDNKSDRMGYRLSGNKIHLKYKLEMISEEINIGTIQIPPDGNPIILLADRQTVGGYPKIANVALVDIPKVVQLKPNEIIRFEKITLLESENLYFKREEYLKKLKQTLKLIFI